MVEKPENQLEPCIVRVGIVHLDCGSAPNVFEGINIEQKLYPDVFKPLCEVHLSLDLLQVWGQCRICKPEKV